ncbi:hypothetical protein B484DRAFT_412478, partial [Ochromonadaceae sp. CCMP2298]
GTKKRGTSFNDTFQLNAAQVFDLTEDEKELISDEKRARREENELRTEEMRERMVREQQVHEMQLRKDELSLKEREAALQGTVVMQSLVKLLADKGLL